MRVITFLHRCNSIKMEVVNPKLFSFFTFLLFSIFTFSTSLDMQYQTQPVDHFGHGNLSRQTFQQRFVVDYKYMSGNSKHMVKSAPIVVYFGGEANLEDSITEFRGFSPAILLMTADRLGALILYIEHRFYGKSIPYGSIELALSDTEIRGCLTSTQALEDFVNVIQNLRKNLSSVESPVIVMGASYAGMLAAWFRLRYPHVAVGALASSAPIISFLELPVERQYCSIVSKDFKETNQRCFDHISKSWALIDHITSQPSGLKILDRTFKTCSPLYAGNQVKDYLVQMFLVLAQYNGIYDSMSQVCDTIAAASDDNILEGISQAALVMSQQQVCNNITSSVSTTGFDEDSQLAWNWQTCNEFVSAPYSCSNDSMFESHPFKLSEYLEECQARYGVDPHPETWMSSTYYHGKDAKSAFKDFGSNIIFSNGLKDPWSGASILEDISESVVAVTTAQGSHCLDMNVAEDDDPKWLVKQRKKELGIMVKWINPSSGGFMFRYVGWFIMLTISMTLHYLFFC